jgi:hypothetical protein
VATSRKQIFLSYAGGDRATARRLAEGLREQSLSVWTDELLSPGDNWAARMADALGQSDAMVVLLSPESVKSEWVRRDIAYALTSQRFEHRLIPVVIGKDDAEKAEWLRDAPWVLRRLPMVASPSAEVASRRVADVLKRAG